jgi:hypothetical protein
MVAILWTTDQKHLKGADRDLFQSFKTCTASFNKQLSYILSTKCIYRFSMILRANSDYSLNSIDHLIF